MASRDEFDAFVTARYPALLRTAYLLVRDRDQAEDLLQTALTKTWFAWGRIQNDPTPYVRRVMVTTSVSWWRRRWSSEVPTEELPEPHPGPSADPGLDRHDLWVAIGHLSAMQRSVIVLRYYEDLTELETAEVLNCSVGTVKSHSSRALAKLRADASLEPLTEEGVRHEH